MSIVLKLQLLILSGIVVLCTDLAAQSLTFERTYGDRLFFREVVRSNTDYYVAGKSIDTAAVEQAWIFKVDEEGAPLWNVPFSGKGSARFNAITNTTSGGCIAVGTTETTALTNRTGLVVKCDADGDTLWTTTLALGASTELFGIQPVPGGGYAISGRSGTPVGGLLDAVLFRIEENGDLTWTKNYGSSSLEQFFDLTVTADGEFTMVGSFFDGTIDRVYMIHADTAGELSWSKTFSHGESDYGYSIISTPSDEGYLIVGQGTFSGNPQAMVVKTDSMGLFMWERSYGSPAYDRFRDIFLNSDGDLMTCGSFAKISGSTQAAMFLLNGNGDSLWLHLYGGGGDDEFHSITDDGAGGYVFVGSKANKGYIVRTGAEGIVCQEPGGLSSVAAATSADLTWDPLPGLLGYTVEFRKFGEFDFTPAITSASSIELTGLTPESFYQWRVSSSCSATENSPFSQLDTFMTGASTGIYETENAAIRIYPNPVYDKLYVELQKQEYINVEVLDVSGSLILTTSINGSGSVDLSSLPAGMYFVKIKSEEENSYALFKIVR